MAAVVELRLGDLFDGPSDVVVLPCSTVGTITPFVANRLLEYAIPIPRSGMGLGEVDIAPLTGGENIAQFVAFAASVGGGSSSSPNAIKSIGAALGSFTREQSSARAISAPLLGAGAGGLRSETVVQSLSGGFQDNAVDDASLVIHVLHRSVFDRLRGGVASVTEERPQTPQRVFISYSGTSERHSRWVAELATFLRQNGVDARLDLWHLRKGMDLPQWMANELDLAERVIIISDSRYTDRADKRSGGVGWETMLIQGDISQLPPDTRKYIVIVRETEFNKGVPRYLKTRFAIHWSDDADEGRLRKELLQELYEIELAPPIGRPPSLYVTM